MWPAEGIAQRTRTLPLGVFFCSVAILPHVYKLTFPLDQLLSGFIPDDAFYYYKVALNIHDGFESTFDRINFTNGYHPLWMALCVVTAQITTDPDRYLMVILAVNLGFVFLVNLQLWRMFHAELGTWFTALALVILNGSYPSGRALFSGLETPLNTLLALKVIEVLWRSDLSKRSSQVTLGALCGLAFLARTDFVLFTPVLLAALLFRGRREAGSLRLRAALPVIAAGGAALSVPYVLYNYATTAHIEQVSGVVRNYLMSLTGIPVNLDTVRQSMSQIGYPVRLDPPIVDRLLIVPLAALALGATIVGKCAKPAMAPARHKSRSRDQLATMVAYSLVLAVFYTVKFPGHLVYWWMCLPYVTMVIVTVAVLKSAFAFVIENYPLFKFAVCGLLSLLALAHFMQTFQTREYLRTADRNFVAEFRQDATNWIKANLPPDAIVGVFNAGYVGYFSDRRVVNLDGLINSFEYYEAMRANRCWEFIRAQKIGYIADYFFGDVKFPESCPISGHDLRLIHSVGKTEVTQHGARVPFDYYLWKVKPDS